MDSDERDGRQRQAGHGRGHNLERSPGGSVKRARERIAAARITDAPPLPFVVPPLKPRTPAGQSPKKKTSSPPEQDPTSSVGESGSPPKRPQRPDYVHPMYEGAPPISSQTEQQAPSLSFPPSQTQAAQAFGQSPTASQPYWQEDRDRLSALSGYSAGSSRPSTVATGSSTASIPEFPQAPNLQVPPAAYQAQPRRSLGPPPSSRRGVSSYYSQASFVNPIPEERSDAHSSFASSHVMPESWGNGPPAYYTSHSGTEEEELGEDVVPEAEEEGGEESEQTERRSEDSSGRHSKASDYNDQSSLVRGPPRTKPLQPFMDPIESGDESEASKSSRNLRHMNWPNRPDQRFASGYPRNGGPDGIGRHDSNSRLNTYSGYESDATFLDSPRSTASGMPRDPKSGSSSAYFGDDQSLRGSSMVDPRIGQILGHLEKGGALASTSGTTSPGETYLPSMNEKGIKRPPPLNLGESRSSPARGSQSSLPELIRRATRLASNLDRGKTSSTAGLLDMLNRKEAEKRVGAGAAMDGGMNEKAPKDGSISDMLAAFPAPSPTSTGPSKSHPWSSPSPHGKSNLSRSQTVTYDNGRPAREPARELRVCGMPMWGLGLLVIIILLLIAAAVVIPITLVVIPRQNKPAATVASCKQSNPCANGGTSLVLDKGCRCICAGGWTGSSCSQQPDSTCCTYNIPADGSAPAYSNATLGSDLPRILAAASTNYSLPLSRGTVTALMNYNNLSCASENALVAINTKSSSTRRAILSQRRRRSLVEVLSGVDSSHSEDSNGQAPLQFQPVALADLLVLRPSKTLSGRSSAQSSNGIVFAGGSSPSGSSNGGVAPTESPLAVEPSAASTASASSATTTANAKPITSQTLDFARTAILFVLQVSDGDLGRATAAMTHLQTVLSQGVGGTFDSSQTGIGSNTTIDLVGLTVGFGNGTIYGGKGSS